MPHIVCRRTSSEWSRSTLEMARTMVEGHAWAKTPWLSHSPLGFGWRGQGWQSPLDWRQHPSDRHIEKRPATTAGERRSA